MKIVLLNDDSLPSAQGGAAVVVEHLRKSFTQNGHQVTLVTSHQHDQKKLIDTKDDFGRIISIPITNKKGKRHIHSVSYPKHLSVIESLFDELRPDVVHAHNIHNYLSYNCLTIATKHTNRIFLTAHDTFLVSFGRVNSNNFLENSRNGKAYTLKLSDHIASAGRNYNPFRNMIIRHILHKTNTKVVAISHMLKDFLEANAIQITEVISNGTPIYDPIQSKKITEFKKQFSIQEPCILFGGRVSVDKGFDALLQALPTMHKECPDTQVLVAGDADRTAAILSQVDTVDKSKIISLGWLPSNQMRIAYASATLVTTPSVYLDPFNLMNIEAMAEQKPVITSCFSGGRELIIDGQTGFVCDPTNTTAYADAMIKLLRNTSLASQYGENGRRHVSEQYSTTKQASQYEQLFENTSE